MLTVVASLAIPALVLLYELWASLPKVGPEPRVRGRGPGVSDLLGILSLAVAAVLAAGGGWLVYHSLSGIADRVILPVGALGLLFGLAGAAADWAEDRPGLLPWLGVAANVAAFVLVLMLDIDAAT
jgi:hypothetical protein